MTQSKMLSRNQKYNILIFLAVFTCYLAMTLFLFHRQSVVYEGQYNSDLPPYIEYIRGEETGYDFPYPVLFRTGRLLMLFTSPTHAMAIAVAGWNALSAVVMKILFDNRLEARSQDSLSRGAASTGLTFSMLFLSMLFPLNYLGKTGEPLQYLRYKGVFTPNPYHNATYLAARPFAIVSFLLLAKLLSTYEREEHPKPGKYIAFAVFLLLSTMTKPSFTLVAVSTAGVIMLWRLVRSRFRGFSAFFRLGICFIPTFADLIYQFRGVFMGGSEEMEKGIGIGFLTAWSTATDHVPTALLLGLCFPLVVLLFHPGALRKDSEYQLSWQILIMSVIQFVFLYEKGFRLAHLNFAWGYMCGMFLVFLTSLALLARETACRDTKAGNWKILCQWCAFALHLLCGLDYFRVLLQGGLFL